MGGTFQGLHDGHRQYLEIAAELAEFLFVFVLADCYARARKSYPVDPTADRINAIRAYLEKKGVESAYEFREVYEAGEVDRFLATADVDLVVTEPCHRERFARVNAQRLECGRPEYYVLVKPRSREPSQEISATFLQQGRGL